MTDSDGATSSTQATVVVQKSKFLTKVVEVCVFFCWDISVICVIVAPKLAVTLFSAYRYFQIFWLKWLNVFREFQKRLGVWPKKTSGGSGVTDGGQEGQSPPPEQAKCKNWARSVDISIFVFFTLFFCVFRVFSFFYLVCGHPRHLEIHYHFLIFFWVLALVALPAVTGLPPGSNL